MNFLNELPRPFFILAPMDDVTDTVFRQIVTELAPPDFFMSEFVNVDGLQSPGRQRLIHKLQLDDMQVPVVAQIWGLKPGNYYRTTKELIGMGYAGVDINMGCPVKTVIKNGACSALINDRILAGEIIDATREAAGDTLPVSVKTRVGFTTPDLSWPEFLLSKKLNMLSIHGRTTKQMSKVPADWDMIGSIRQLRDGISPSTLIIGNGDVMNRHSGEVLAEKFGLDGIMIGRGIFQDPFAFSANSPWGAWSRLDKIALYRSHIKLFARTWHKNERRIETLNKFCKVYINGFDGAKELREKLMGQDSVEELLEVLDTAAKAGDKSYIPAAV